MEQKEDKHFDIYANKFKKLSFDDIRHKGFLMYEYIRGSKSYGLDIPGKSDTDYGGVYISPADTMIGLGFDYQPQIENDSHDIVWWDINRYIYLLLKSNPTALESLFIPDELIIYEHPLITELKKHRNEFVTKKCFNAFGGYAISQIKKARSLKKKIVNPIEKRLFPLDFAYVPYKQGSSKLRNWLEYRGMEQCFCGLTNIPNMPNSYNLYYDWGNHFMQRNIKIDELVDIYNDVTEYDTIHTVNILHEAENMKDSERVKEYSEKLAYMQKRNMVKFICSFYNIEDEFGLVQWFMNEKPHGYSGIVNQDGKSNEMRIKQAKKVSMMISKKSENEIEHMTMIENQDGTQEVLDIDEIKYSSIEKNDYPLTIVSYNKDGYSQHCREYNEYTQWLHERNPVRYSENKGKNFDRKNMMHSERLLRMAIEIAKTGEFNVDRRNIDRDYLLNIRLGNATYDELINELDDLKKEFDKACAESNLPEDIDVKKVNNILLDIRWKQILKEIQTDIQ